MSGRWSGHWQASLLGEGYINIHMISVILVHHHSTDSPVFDKVEDLKLNRFLLNIPQAALLDTLSVSLN